MNWEFSLANQSIKWKITVTTKVAPCILFYVIKCSLLSQMMIAVMKPVVAARSSLLDSLPHQTTSHELLWFKKPVNDLHRNNNISDKPFLQTALSAVEMAVEGALRTGNQEGLTWIDVSEQIYKRCSSINIFLQDCLSQAFAFSCCSVSVLSSTLTSISYPSSPLPPLSFILFMNCFCCGLHRWDRCSDYRCSFCWSIGNYQMAGSGCVQQWVLRIKCHCISALN